MYLLQWTVMWKRHNGFIVLFLLGIILRIAIIFWAVQFREHPDILRWKDWGQIAFLHGFADTYTTTHLSFGTYPNNMPPFTLYIVSVMYWVWLQMGKVFAVFGIAPGSNPWINTVLLTLFLRIPSMICDLGITILIYRMVRLKKALFASSLFLFNPIIIYNSAVWGQMDAINNFFFIGALYLLFIKKNSASVISFACSLFTKLSLVIMAPVIALVLWLKEKNIRAMLWYLYVFIFVVLGSILPISYAPWTWFGNFMMHNATGEMTNVTAFAFNVWWVIFHPTLLFGPNNDAFDVANISLNNSPLVETIYGSISLGTISILVAIICSAIVYFLWYTRFGKAKSIQLTDVLRLVASIAITSFLVFPQMHERYLYPAFAPLAILVGFGFSIHYELALLALLNLVNLLIVWHPMPLPWWMYNLMREATFQWIIAFVTVVAGFWTIKKLLSRK